MAASEADEQQVPDDKNGVTATNLVSQEQSSFANEVAVEDKNGVTVTNLVS